MIFSDKFIMIGYKKGPYTYLNDIDFHRKLPTSQKFTELNHNGTRHPSIEPCWIEVLRSSHRNVPGSTLPNYFFPSSILAFPCLFFKLIRNLLIIFAASSKVEVISDLAVLTKEYPLLVAVDRAIRSESLFYFAFYSYCRLDPGTNFWSLRSRTETKQTYGLTQNLC